MFNISPKKCFSAVSIFNEMNDPHTSWSGHYSFATYRADESWRGQPCNRYELSPVVDVTRVPEYHYFSYMDACTSWMPCLKTQTNLCGQECQTYNYWGTIYWVAQKIQLGGMKKINWEHEKNSIRGDMEKINWGYEKKLIGGRN